MVVYLVKGKAIGRHYATDKMTRLTDTRRFIHTDEVVAKAMEYRMILYMFTYICTHVVNMQIYMYTACRFIASIRA